MINDAKKKAIILYILLCLNYLIYSASLVVAKFAGIHSFFSVQAIGLYALAIFFLGLFALFYQQILKHMALTVAYASRVITIVYGMFWGFLLFNETITWNMILGGLIIVFGVILVVHRD